MSDISKQAVFIEVEAEVRYWEDATVNGVEDETGTLVPFRFGAKWCPTIRLSDGMVIGWPKGVTADIHYKVCDAGEYWLSSDDERIAKWAGFYVPGDFLCHGPDSEGYGDYIIFKVGPDGQIQDYERPSIEVACECHEEDEQSAWRPVTRAATGDSGEG
jgi:hypothetical protein